MSIRRRADAGSLASPLTREELLLVVEIQSACLERTSGQEILTKVSLATRLESLLYLRCLDATSADDLVAHQIPSWWLEKYLRASRNRVTCFAESSSHVFPWSEAEAFLPDMGTDIEALAEEAGLRNPIALGWGPHGTRSGVFGFSRLPANLLHLSAVLLLLMPHLHFALSRKGPVRTFVQLTAKEREILGLMSDGLTNEQIAQKICRTERAIKYHISNIFRKLNVRNRSQAIVKVINQDLV
jgi:DNA-binding CsgD family transcriptional regulator